MEQVEKLTGNRPEELDNLVEFPSDMAYQWRYFVELHGKRSSNGFGINPISYQDMYAYFKLIRHTPEEWEIDLLNQLDNVFLEVHNKQQESQQKKK